MKEHPILFSAPMIRALLAGTKSQTRRIIKLPHQNPLGKWEPTTFGGPGLRTRKGETIPEHAAIWHTRTGEVIGPAWLTGDRLWVRETTRSYYMENFLTGEPTNALCGQYVADDEPVVNEHGFDLAWWYSRKSCPAIHMPRWVSRITLEVSGVRVERLQAISEADAKAEGMPASVANSPRVWYQGLWDGINGAGSWEANPWVWAVAFKRG